MRLPRDLSGNDLVQRLKALGYEATRQSGSHIRLTTLKEGEHHITVPLHLSLRIGTLNAIVTDIANHFQCSREKILKFL